MISTVDPDKSIFITHEAGWNNTRLYIHGKVIKEFSSGSELKDGANFYLEDFGSVEMKLNSATFSLSLTVDDKPFEEEKTALQISESMNGPIGIFAILAIINFFVFAFALLGSMDPFESSNKYDFVMLLTSGFYTLTYSLTLIFTIRKVYFFYFIGTALYTLTSLYYCSILIDDLNGITITIIGVRFLLMFVLLYHFKRAVGFVRGKNAPKGEDVIDNDF